MSGIDRRTLLGAAGAGLVLAGCSGKTKHRTGMVGTCALFGQPATDAGPEVEGNVTSFEPDGICIVYLKFVANMMLARRTYISTDGLAPTDPAIVTKVVEELKRISQWGSAHPIKDRNDLHPVKLLGQKIVVVYVNNKQDFVRFAYKRNGTIQDERETYPHLIRFTQFSGDDPVNLSRIIRKNHAFFNLRKVSLTGLTGNMQSNEAFFLDFWNTDEYGDKIEAKENQLDTHYIYSMNIKLEMAAFRAPNATERFVPVIVDPDTGNMGAEP